MKQIIITKMETELSKICPEDDNRQLIAKNDKKMRPNVLIYCQF